MALIRPSIDLRQFSFSEEGSTYNEKKHKCICVMSAVCVCCVLARVRCHVLRWKHPGLQLAGSRFNPRCRSRQNRIKRSGGSEGAGGAAAPHCAWAAGDSQRDLYSTWFLLLPVLHEDRDAWKTEESKVVKKRMQNKREGPQSGQAGPVAGSTATGRVRTGGLCDDN